MLMDPRTLAAVMQRMQPMGAADGQGIPGSGAPPQQGVPVQMQGVMNMQPVQALGGPQGPPGGAPMQDVPQMPPRRF